MIPGVSPDGVAQQLAAFNAVVEQIAAAAAEQEMHHRDAKDAANETARARWELMHRHISDIVLIARTAIPDAVRTTAALKRPTKRDAEHLIAAGGRALAEATSGFRSYCRGALEHRGSESAGRQTRAHCCGQL